MSVKEELHQLVDQLPEGDLHTARRFLEYLCSPQVPQEEADPEPLSPEALEGVRKAEAIRRGEYVTLEDYERESGL